LSDDERSGEMLAYRTTWIVKEGHMQEALEAVSAEIERTRKQGDPLMRVYTPDIAPNVLVFEMVSESAEAHDQFWAAYDRDSPQGTAFWKKWGEVSERSTGTDRWNLAEWR
jgi:hypothetical protein